MAKVACPECIGAAGFTDYWGEWDECKCCNPDGSNDTGKVSDRRLAKYRKEQEADEAHWDKIIADAKARGEIS